MAVKGWDGMRWGKWFVVGGACVASGAALWWYVRKQTKNAINGSKGGIRPTASVAPCPVLFPGMQSSKEVKDKGNEYFKQCSYRKAIEAFTEAINLCPPEYKNHLAVCYQNRAAAYDRLGDPDRSIIDCTKALELDPLYFKAVVRRAKAYLSLSRPEEALDDLTYAFVMNPEASESLKTDVDSAVALAAANLVEHVARFALMKENVTSLKERLAAFDSMWNTLNEDSRCEITNKRFRSMYYILLATWKILEHCSDVESEFNHAVEIDQTNVDIYLGAAFLLSENGQLQEAIDYLDQLDKIDPTHHLVKHMRANCKMALKASVGDVGGAVACMAKVDQLLQMNQNADPVLYLITGRLYYAAQNKELAKASFKKAAEGIPDYAAPMFYLAMVEAEEMEGSPNQMAVLESKMKICLEREKANPDALAILAKIAFQRQQLDEALRLYEQCIEVCPVHTNEASLLPAVTDYVQIRSLRKAVETLQRTTASPVDISCSVR
uniref:TPR_REGION domain-containing protein n=1 Tax=Elaeophora elaphi TaxID=1147741 RepID=A0A0R3S0N5_9BILA